MSSVFLAQITFLIFPVFCFDLYSPRSLYNTILNKHIARVSPSFVRDITTGVGTDQNSISHVHIRQPACAFAQNRKDNALTAKNILIKYLSVAVNELNFIITLKERADCHFKGHAIFYSFPTRFVISFLLFNFCFVRPSIKLLDTR